MDSSHPPEKQISPVLFDASSPASLLEHGIDCARQGYWLEATSLFMLARERLSPDQQSLVDGIDGLIQSHASYRQAQQALHQTYQCFAETEDRQQTHLLALEQLLTTFKEETRLQVYSDGAQIGVASRGATGAPGSISHNARPVNTSPRHATSPDTLSQVPLSALDVTCFGHFEVRRLGQIIPLCHNRSGQTILRYLVAQPSHEASFDTLMDILWPDDVPEVARRKLQIAVSAVRCSLNNGYPCDTGSGYILCKDQFYQLNPAVLIRTDVDEFLSCWWIGRQKSGREAVEQYERACQLYTGPFLNEDKYASWSALRREQLAQLHLTMCRALTEYHLQTGQYEESEKWANKVLKEDRCDEEAHRQLIRLYAIQGRRSASLRQYQRCEQVLRDELDIPPMPETVKLFQAVLADENIFTTW